MKNRQFLLFVILSIVVTIVVINYLQSPQRQAVFSGEKALKHVENQVAFGPRIPDSDAHAKTVTYIAQNLRKNGWEVKLQKVKVLGHPITNVVARRGTSEDILILGAHYDSRLLADQDKNPARAQEPVMGANDGASGVGVLLELARVLPKDLDKQVWLVFFDAEDQGDLPGWEWIMGSRAFVRSLNVTPSAVVVIDMIGDTDLNIYREYSSDKALTDQIWKVAADLGYPDSFINNERYNILDDHTPFLEAGYPAIDIIDFDYPNWHTSRDTLEHVSAKSLETVGKTLYTWIIKP